MEYYDDRGGRCILAAALVKRYIEHKYFVVFLSCSNNMVSYAICIVFKTKIDIIICININQNEIYINPNNEM